MARCLLVDSRESRFEWHSDDKHTTIAKDAVVWHMNWMVTEDYLPGSVKSITSPTSSPTNTPADGVATKSALSPVLDRPNEPVRIRYLCGKDIVAMDHGRDVRGQHNEELAYLRIWEVNSQKAEWELTS